MQGDPDTNHVDRHMDNSLADEGHRLVERGSSYTFRNL